jgi:hypothetical protein
MAMYNADKQTCKYRCHVLLTVADPSSRQRGRPTSTKPQTSDSNKILVLGPRWGLTPGLTGRLTVGRSVSLALTSRKWTHLEPRDSIPRQRLDFCAFHSCGHEEYYVRSRHAVGIVQWLTDVSKEHAASIIRVEGKEMANMKPVTIQ